MAIVGAFARIEADGFDQAVADLGGLEGVSTFALDEPGKIGLLIEAASLDDAHGVITRQIPAVVGVLGAWPVYANTEDESDQESSPA
ncbi:MAG: hypothetical protein H6810_02880 [Phycisphaeraceae bacterium]|nr:MAG: hypothetical protein H6810_02880 [Phycisphaeraceae bacterium]